MLNEKGINFLNGSYIAVPNYPVNLNSGYKTVANTYNESEVTQVIKCYITDGISEFEVKKCVCGKYHQIISFPMGFITGKKCPNEI